jgi:hypothetical protein
MEHVASVVSVIGFFLASVIAGLVFARKTGPIEPWLRQIKEWIVERSHQNPHSEFWRRLSEPDAVTFATLIVGTFLVFAGQLTLLAVNW